MQLQKMPSHENYTNELISFMNELNKLWFARGNYKSWIQIWFQQKHAMV